MCHVCPLCMSLYLTHRATGPALRHFLFWPLCLSCRPLAEFWVHPQEIPLQAQRPLLKPANPLLPAGLAACSPRQLANNCAQTSNLKQRWLCVCTWTMVRLLRQSVCKNLALLALAQGLACWRTPKVLASSSSVEEAASFDGTLQEALFFFETLSV